MGLDGAGGVVVLPLLVGFILFEGLVVAAGVVSSTGFVLFPVSVGSVVFEGLVVPDELFGVFTPVGFTALLSFVGFLVFEDV